MPPAFFSSEGMPVRLAIAAVGVSALAVLHVLYATRHRASNASRTAAFRLVCFGVFCAHALTVVVAALSECVGDLVWWYALATPASMALGAAHVHEDERGEDAMWFLLASAMLQTVSGINLIDDECDATTRALALGYLLGSTVETMVACCVVVRRRGSRALVGPSDTSPRIFQVVR